MILSFSLGELAGWDELALNNFKLAHIAAS